jgi:hypothetical protein
VDEVQVQVLHLKLREGVIEGGLNGSRVVLGVPELASDEDVLTLEARNVLVGTLDALGNFLLVLVAVIGGITRQLALVGEWWWEEAIAPASFRPH